MTKCSWRLLPPTWRRPTSGGGGEPVRPTRWIAEGAISSASCRQLSLVSSFLKNFVDSVTVVTLRVIYPSLPPSDGVCTRAGRNLFFFSAFFYYSQEENRTAVCYKTFFLLFFFPGGQHHQREEHTTDGWGDIKRKKGSTSIWAEEEKGEYFYVDDDRWMMKRGTCVSKSKSVERGIKKGEEKDDDTNKDGWI